MPAPGKYTPGAGVMTRFTSTDPEPFSSRACAWIAYRPSGSTVTPEAPRVTSARDVEMRMAVDGTSATKRREPPPCECNVTSVWPPHWPFGTRPPTMNEMNAHRERSGESTLKYCHSAHVGSDRASGGGR